MSDYIAEDGTAHIESEFEKETREMVEKFRISSIEAEAARYDNIARDYADRYLDEANDVRRKFLYGELVYWSTKAADLRATI